MNDEEISQLREMLLNERNKSEIYFDVLKAFFPLLDAALQSGEDIPDWKIFAAWEICENKFNLVKEELNVHPTT